MAVGFTSQEAPERSEAPQQPTNKALSAWKWLIGYNDNEANRLGVPVVSSADFLKGASENPGGKAIAYAESLLPIRRWILSYNLQWAAGDLIAGVTVGLVVVPQSMSYAIIAGLRPEFGLYSSFVGVMIYALFATSKDVTIGPVAVMSLQTANVIRHVTAKAGANTYPLDHIASALAFVCGSICLGIGVLRIGWIVEFIPTPAVSGFMTGSAITIAIGQIPKLMGLTVTTNGVPTYQILIHSLQQLPKTNKNAAFGLPALAFLYIIRSICVWIPKRYPRLARTAFFISVLRNAFVMILFTLASRLWLGHKNPKAYPISILKTVPSGFKHMQVPDLNTRLLGDLAPEIPVSTIVLLLEHIAISKSFGRLNNYKIDPNQELIAMGVTNLFGPFFGGYAATGSFSRTAIKSKSGVRTPLAGWITGIIVVIALYALTGTFYWIPNAALSAVIIHAVGDLIASPRALYQFWLINPLELAIWFAAVLTTVFSTVENGVYVSVGTSLALLLIRIARPRGKWLGIVKVRHANVDNTAASEHDVFLPLPDQNSLTDPSINVLRPPPGVLIYRFEEAFTYPNASHLADLLIDKAKEETRPGRDLSTVKRGDRPWNDPGPPHPYVAKFFNTITGNSHKNVNIVNGEYVVDHTVDPRPLLKAFVFDFSSVANVDTTSVQTLVDVRRAVELHAGRQVEFHFAGALSPWIRRGLLAGGFGTGAAAKQIVEVAPVVDARSHEDEREKQRRSSIHVPQPKADIENVNVPELKRQNSSDGASTDSQESGNKAAKADETAANHNRPGYASSSVSVPVIWGNDLTPFFHLDLSGALAAASASK